MAANRKQFVIKMEMKGGKLVARDLKGVETQTALADKSMKGMIGSMDKMKTMLMAGGVFYMAQRAIRGMVSASIDLEAQLAQVSTMLTKQTIHYMPQYRKEMTRMAADFGEATGTLSRGLYDILSASIDAGKAMDVLRISAMAAKAGVTDTGVAADAITTILNSYRMQAEEAGRVSDILFGIVKRGKTTFAELAPQIGIVAATAAQTGLRLEEMGAFLATATRAGLRTEQTVTGLANILTAMSRPGGVLTLTTLRTKGLVGIMEELNGATAEQLALIFPNIRAMRGFAAAMSDTAGFIKDVNMLTNAQGLTQEALQKQMDITKTKMERAWQITLNWGRELGGVFSDVLTVASEMIIKLDELAEKTPKISAYGLQRKWFATLLGLETKTAAPPEWQGPPEAPKAPAARAPMGGAPGRPGPSEWLMEIPPFIPTTGREIRNIQMFGGRKEALPGTGQDALIDKMFFFQEAAERAFTGANRSMDRFTMHGQTSAMILGNSFGNAFAMMASGAQGAGDAISGALLGALGQIATYWGQYFIGVGTAAQFVPGGQIMWGAIAKGAALMALGGIISGLAGRGGGGGYGGGGYGGYGGYNAPGQGVTPATQIIIIRGGDGESIDSALNRAGVDRALRNKLYELGRTGDLDFLRS